MSSDPGWWARQLGNQQSVESSRPPSALTTTAPPQELFRQPQPQSQQAPQVTVENLFEMAQYWTGSVAHKTDPYPCPKCGGQHYYSRAAEVSRGPAPAPMCFDCGYNGMFAQGDMATWQAGSA